MKAAKYIMITLFCFTFVTSGLAQDDKESKRAEAEKSTKPFGLNYFTSSENRLFILEVAVIDKAIVLDTTATIKEVPGKLPYPSGDFNVSVMGANNEVIADFKMPDPVVQRSCEEGKDNLGVLDNGRISITLPGNRAITRVILKRDNEEVSNLDVATLIREMPREDPNKN